MESPLGMNNAGWPTFDDGRVFIGDFVCYWIHKLWSMFMISYLFPKHDCCFFPRWIYFYPKVYILTPLFWHGFRLEFFEILRSRDINRFLFGHLNFLLVHFWFPELQRIRKERNTVDTLPLKPTFWFYFLKFLFLNWFCIWFYGVWSKLNLDMWWNCIWHFELKWAIRRQFIHFNLLNCYLIWSRSFVRAFRFLFDLWFDFQFFQETFLVFLLDDVLPKLILSIRPSIVLKNTDSTFGSNENRHN